MRRFVPFGLMAAFLLILAPSLQAQGVSGDWTLTYTMMGRPEGQAMERTMDVTLKQDGEAITGTALMAMRGRPGGEGGGEPQEVPISEGKLEGDQITFTVARSMGERTMAFVFTGTVSGNAMEGTMTMAGGMRGGDPIPFKGVKKEG